MPCKGYYRISIKLFNFFVWTGENDWKTLSVGKYFLKTEKNLRFQKYPDPCIWRVDRAFRSVHMYPDIFENGAFSEKYASTRSVFVSFSPVHKKTLKQCKYD